MNETNQEMAKRNELARARQLAQQTVDALDAALAEQRIGGTTGESTVDRMLSELELRSKIRVGAIKDASEYWIPRRDAERARAEKAEALVEQWKEASGLVAGGDGGDPDGVTPAAAAKWWGELEGKYIVCQGERDDLRARAEKAEARADKAIAMLDDPTCHPQVAEWLVKHWMRELSMVVEGETSYATRIPVGDIVNERVNRLVAELAAEGAEG